MNSSTMTVSTRKMLAQADVLLLLRDILIQPITRQPLFSLQSRRELQTLFSQAGLADARALAGGLFPLWQSMVSDQATTLGQAHFVLFEGNTPCPVTETAFIRRDKGAVLADIAGFYAAFGFECGPLGEKPDHIAIELEFAAVLLIMQAQARENDNAQGTEVSASALAAFLGDHLGEWVLSFCDRLEKTSDLPLHQQCARILAAACQAVVTTHGLAPLPRDLEPQKDESDGSSFECGSVNQPVQLTANCAPIPQPPSPLSTNPNLP